MKQRNATQLNTTQSIHFSYKLTDYMTMEDQLPLSQKLCDDNNKARNYEKKNTFAHTFMIAINK